MMWLFPLNKQFHEGWPVSDLVFAFLIYSLKIKSEYYGQF